MSRIGVTPIRLPKGVSVAVSGNQVKVKGPKGELTRHMELYTGVTVDGDVVRVTRDTESQEARARHGLMRADLNNMVQGVAQGFERRLVLTGVGYRAQMKGKTLSMSLGFSHPVDMEVPAGLEVVTEGTGTIVVRGIDRARVGQMAANIRRHRPPEPYKGKGIAYSDEKVRRKEGKSGKGK